MFELRWKTLHFSHASLLMLRRACTSAIIPYAGESRKEGFSQLLLLVLPLPAARAAAVPLPGIETTLVVCLCLSDITQNMRASARVNRELERVHETRIDLDRIIVNGKALRLSGLWALGLGFTRL